MSSCLGPPQRLSYPGLGQCGDYLTHRPHLSMHAYRDIAFPLYPQSNPAKYADQFRDVSGKVQTFSATAVPKEESLVWNYPLPSGVSPACLPIHCP